MNSLFCIKEDKGGLVYWHVQLFKSYQSGEDKGGLPYWHVQLFIITPYKGRQRGLLKYCHIAILIKINTGEDEVVVEMLPY